MSESFKKPLTPDAYRNNEAKVDNLADIFRDEKFITGKAITDIAKEKLRSLQNETATVNTEKSGYQLRIRSEDGKVEHKLQKGAKVKIIDTAIKNEQDADPGYGTEDHIFVKVEADLGDTKGGKVGEKVQGWVSTEYIQAKITEKQNSTQNIPPGGLDRVNPTNKPTNGTTPGGLERKKAEEKPTDGTTPGGLERKKAEEKPTDGTTPGGLERKKAEEKPTDGTTPGGLERKKAEEKPTDGTTPGGLERKKAEEKPTDGTTPGGVSRTENPVTEGDEAKPSDLRRTESSSSKPEKKEGSWDWLDWRPEWWKNMFKEKPPEKPELLSQKIMSKEYFISFLKEIDGFKTDISFTSVGRDRDDSIFISHDSGKILVTIPDVKIEGKGTEEKLIVEGTEMSESDFQSRVTKEMRQKIIAARSTTVAP